MISFFRPKRKVSPELIKVLKEREALRLAAYQDTGGVWTIGWGHTGGDIAQGQIITEQQAEEFLVADLAWAEAAVNKQVKVALSQNQFDALVSLVFNIGAARFKGSTLLAVLNQGKYDLAAKEFCRWIYDNGKVITGLVKRRCHESLIFAAGIY